MQLNWDIQSWRLAGPAEATNAFQLPKTAFAYKLLSLVVRVFATSITPTVVQARVTLLDGGGLTLGIFQTVELTQSPVTTGQYYILTFAPGLFCDGTTFFDQFGGIQASISPLPDEFWVLPQWSLKLELIGAQAGGGSGGGDSWLDTTFIVAIPPRP